MIDKEFETLSKEWIEISKDLAQEIEENCNIAAWNYYKSQTNKNPSLYIIACDPYKDVPGIEDETFKIWNERSKHQWTQDFGRFSANMV